MLPAVRNSFERTGNSLMRTHKAPCKEEEVDQDRDDGYKVSDGEYFGHRSAIPYYPRTVVVRLRRKPTFAWPANGMKRLKRSGFNP